jgi:hypothetical protein
MKDNVGSLVRPYNKYFKIVRKLLVLLDVRAPKLLRPPPVGWALHLLFQAGKSETQISEQSSFGK